MLFDNVGKFIVDKAKEGIKERATSVLPSFMHGWFSDEEEKEIEPKAKSIFDHAQEGRSDMLGEVFESFLNRKFPKISKAMDLLSTAGVTKRDPEIFAWQNEFETLTALTMLMPDSILHHVTDPLVNSEIFLKAVALYHEELAEKIRNEKDPDDVVDALRELHQYVSTGKLTIDKIRS